MSESDLTLKLNGASLLPPNTAQQCTQILEPFLEGSMVRTVNGDLVYVGEDYSKYTTTIRGRDKKMPTLEAFSKGHVLEVGCIQEISQAIPRESNTVALEREAVKGSLYVLDENGKHHTASLPSGGKLTLPDGIHEGYLCYRPLLNMLVRSFFLETDEWGMTVGWVLKLEEV